MIGGLWGFVNGYLIFLCVPALQGEDILYLNLLLCFFGVCWLIRDYQKWRRLKNYFQNPEAFLAEEEKKILGEELYGYVCKIQEEQQKEAAEYTRRLGELSDYIARWSHEAKLPLTSLKLMNQRNQDTGLERDMQDCIMRLEGRFPKELERNLLPFLPCRHVIF